jgi:hypothetical protein
MRMSLSSIPLTLAMILPIGLLVPATAESQALRIYPVPDGIATRESFDVRARSAGGEWRTIDCYEVEVDMHNPRLASMAYFDFDGAVEVEVTWNGSGPLLAARIRPLAHGIEPRINGNRFTFSLSEPRNLSIEVNGDRFDNLHLFAGPIETDIPDPADPNVIFFGPGVHEPGDALEIPSNTTVYLAGGAVVKSKLLCHKVENVRIHGRGVLYHPGRGVEITLSRNVEVNGITVINPRHYTILGGQSRDLIIRNIKSFSSRGWSDGIDLMSCSDVLIDGVFLRNSDDVIAIYGHRWDYYGDVRNITVQNSSLWADVAHAINIGGHGNAERPEIIENLVFRNLDILNHDEPQVGYQGSFSIACADNNLVRNVLVDDMRVEEIERGQLLNIRVLYNPRFSLAPGGGIENITIKNLSYSGEGENISIIGGYNEQRAVKNIVFVNLNLNGLLIWDEMPQNPGWWSTADMAGFHIGPHVHGLEFRREENVPQRSISSQND